MILTHRRRAILAASLVSQSYFRTTHHILSDTKKQVKHPNYISGCKPYGMSTVMVTAFYYNNKKILVAPFIDTCVYINTSLKSAY